MMDRCGKRGFFEGRLTAAFSCGKLTGEAGFSMVLVLWVLAMVMLLAAEFAYTVRVESSTVRNLGNRTAAYYLAVSSVEKGIAAPTGLAAFLTDGSRFFGILQALASDGKVKVLSNPHIMVKNYEKASINIGSDEPVATQSTQTAVTGTAGLIQNIEYRKTGVLLTVTTQITEGGMIALTVRQEVSNKSTDRTVGNAVYPSFSKREAETSVVSKDGETILIGGLIDENKDVTKSGVPLLKDIPLLGNLFRFTNITESRTELAILLTAKVIANPETAASVSDEFKKRVKDASDLLKKGALN